MTRTRSGRPPKPTPPLGDDVLGWLELGATEFGFATGRWTARRLAAVLARERGVDVNQRYLSDWLGRHGVTPQLPRARAVAADFPRVEVDPLPPSRPSSTPSGRSGSTSSSTSWATSCRPADVPGLDRAIHACLDETKDDHSTLRSFFTTAHLSWDGLTGLF